MSYVRGLYSIHSSPRKGALRMIIVKPQLVKILTERGYTQNGFAKKFKISLNAVNRFDRSVQHRSENVFLIARALELKVDELFEVIEVKGPTSELIKTPVSE